MQAATGAAPRMWGDAIVGFDHYRYKYATGRTGEWPIVAFSPRKQNLTLYIMAGFDLYDDLLGKLGKHSTGKSCLYVKRLSDLDMAVLETELIGGVGRAHASHQPMRYPMNIRFAPVAVDAIKPVLPAHVLTLASPIDSFLEDHILQSHHYRIVVDGEVAGWTAIHNEALITQFGLDARYRHLGQRVFAQVRKLEQAREAFVPTCDEFFLAHALDDYRLLEKQAYFFQARPRCTATAQRRPGLTHRPAHRTTIAHPGR